MSPRIVVLGLDSVPPELFFDRFASVMPNVAALRQRSTFGALRTCDPPITVPAWAVMFTGVDPGTLGLYGFRHRPPGRYFEAYTPTPAHLRREPIWHQISRAGGRVAVVGVPPGYPPPAVNGIYVGDFLTPDGAPDAVSPRSAQADLVKAVGGPLLFDLLFRAEDRGRVLEDIHKLTRQRWQLAREIYRREPWELFLLHDIGPDRFHHAFWKFFDPSHPRYVRDSPFSGAAEAYYRLLDEEIGKFVSLLDAETVLLIASDHGSKAMVGGFCINEWLRQNGYLKLRSEPPPNTPLEKCDVDWAHTQVWGAGGYYARLNFNIRGREPQGIVAPEVVPQLSTRLAQELSQVQGPNGRPLGCRLVTPAQTYREVAGDAPDLMAYFGDLDWRSAGTLGHRSLYLEENDTGPDDAVHSWDGIYLLRDPRRTGALGRGDRRSILDVAPTLLTRLGRSVPPWVQGRAIRDWLA